MTTNRRPFDWTRAAIVALIVLIVLLILTGCGGSSSTTPAPSQPTNSVADLTGDWKTADGDIVMEATITADTIEVDWVVDSTTTALYWKGTMPGVIEGKPFVSDADRDALDSSIFGSTADHKAFTYDDDQIAYEFEAMGVKKTLYLERV